MNRNLQNLSRQQLKIILKELETYHDIIQAKNQQLTNHISDLRVVIKKVQIENDQQLNHMIKKKKKLLEDVQRYKAALKIANSNQNNMYQDMLVFKDIYKDN